MSTQVTIAASTAPPADEEQGHRLRLAFAYVLATGLILGLALYGFDFYLLDAGQRPFSPKYELLKPGGTGCVAISASSAV